MERGPLSTATFAKFSKKVVLFCHITSQVKGEPYPGLLDEKGGAGWPYVCFMNDSGQFVARQQRSKVRDDGAAAFEATLTGEVKEFYDLKKAAKGGDNKAKAAFFMKQFELDHLTLDAMKEALGKGRFLSKTQTAEIRERLMEYSVRDCLEGLDTTKPKTFGRYAKKLMKLHKTVGLPEGPAGMTPWYVILEDALERKDAKTFEMAFRALRATGAISRRFFELRSKQLADLKALDQKKKK